MTGKQGAGGLGPGALYHDGEILLRVKIDRLTENAAGTERVVAIQPPKIAVVVAAGRRTCGTLYPVGGHHASTIMELAIIQD